MFVLSAQSVRRWLSKEKDVSLASFNKVQFGLYINNRVGSIRVVYDLSLIANSDFIARGTPSREQRDNNQDL